MLRSLVVAGALAGSAGAQQRSEDLPPELGALERELSLPPLSKAGIAATGSGPRLSNSIEIPFILEGGHIIIEASIDGSPLKPFMFDTGARTVITPEIAQPLRAPLMRTARVGGIGPKISQIEMIKVERITIGAASLEHPTSRSSTLPTPSWIADRAHGWRA